MNLFENVELETLVRQPFGLSLDELEQAIMASGFATVA